MSNPKHPSRLFIAVALVPILAATGCGKSDKTKKAPKITTAQREVNDAESLFTDLVKIKGPLPDWPQGAGEYGESLTSLLLRGKDQPDCGDPAVKDVRCIDSTMKIDAALVFDDWLPLHDESIDAAHFNRLAEEARTASKAVELNSPRVDVRAIHEAAREIKPGVWSFVISWDNAPRGKAYQVNVYMPRPADSKDGNVTRFRCVGVTKGEYADAWPQLRDICLGLTAFSDEPTAPSGAPPSAPAAPPTP